MDELIRLSQQRASPEPRRPDTGSSDRKALSRKEVQKLQTQAVKGARVVVFWRETRVFQERQGVADVDLTWARWEGVVQEPKKSGKPAGVYYSSGDHLPSHDG